MEKVTAQEVRSWRIAVIELFAMLGLAVSLGLYFTLEEKMTEMDFIIGSFVMMLSGMLLFVSPFAERMSGEKPSRNSSRELAYVCAGLAGAGKGAGILLGIVANSWALHDWFYPIGFTICIGGTLIFGLLWWTTGENKATPP